MNTKNVRFFTLFLFPEWFHPLSQFWLHTICWRLPSVPVTPVLSHLLTCLSNCPTLPARFLSVISNFVFLQQVFSGFIPFTLPMSKCSLISVWVLQEADATIGFKMQELYWETYLWRMEGVGIGRRPFRPQCRSDTVKGEGEGRIGEEEPATAMQFWKSWPDQWSLSKDNQWKSSTTDRNGLAWVLPQGWGIVCEGLRYPLPGPIHRCYNWSNQSLCTLQQVWCISIVLTGLVIFLS